MKRDEIYESGISDKRWLAYDLPGNTGWITYFVCMMRCLINNADGFSLAAIIPGGLMLLGVGELISERIARLDRVLPGQRLLRGFGALTMGGIAGVPVSAYGMIRNRHGRKPLWMGIGSALCAVFSGLLFREYSRKEN